MSTILYRNTISIAETAQDMGKLFAEAPHDVQLAFLVSAARVSETWSWPMQCRYIVDDMTAGDKQTVAAWLETLVDHLRDNDESHCARCGRVWGGA